MEDELFIRIETPARMAILRPLSMFVRDLLRSTTCLDDAHQVLNDVELAFNEAFTNIQRHAYETREDGPISIEIRVYSRKLELKFVDRGQSFDPESLKEPDLDRPSDSGLGVWLIRQVMDDFSYYADPEGKNTLVLIKHLCPASERACERTG